MEEGESIRKDYIVRINHTRDMKMYLKVNVLTQTDGIAEALNLKLYDTTNEKLIFDDSIKNLDNTVYERMMPAQGSKKNDTMYVAEAYFDAPVGDKYKMSELEVELKWYVAEEDAKDLIMAKAGDLKIILYSFIAALVVIIFLVVFGRKHLNKQVFAPIEFDDEGRDDYR